MPIEMVRYYFITCDSCDRPFYETPHEDSTQDLSTAERAGWFIDRDEAGAPESAMCPRCQGKPDRPTWFQMYEQVSAKCLKTMNKGAQWSHIQIQILKKGGYRLVARSRPVGRYVTQTGHFANWAYRITEHLAALNFCDAPTATDEPLSHWKGQTDD